MQTREAEGIKLILSLAVYHRCGMPIIRAAAKFLETSPDDPWIKPGAKVWVFDLDQMKSKFPVLSNVEWLHGTVSAEPEQGPHDEICFHIWPNRSMTSPEAHVAGETFIKYGEKAKGLELVKSILRQAKREVCIQDRYIKPILFRLLEECCPDVTVRVLTMDNPQKKQSRETRDAYFAYKSTHPKIEVRFIDKKYFHNRLLLFDAANVFWSDASFSELGQSDGQVSVDANPSEKWVRFEELWNRGKPAWAGSQLLSTP